MPILAWLAGSERRGILLRLLAALFEEWAPRYLGRPGGYTRIMKVGFRRGDAAPVSIVEFIDAEMPEKEGDAPDDDAKKKGILDRIRRKEA